MLVLFVIPAFLAVNQCVSSQWNAAWSTNRMIFWNNPLVRCSYPAPADWLKIFRHPGGSNQNPKSSIT
jgi:hypothetical protein